MCKRTARRTRSPWRTRRTKTRGCVIRTATCGICARHAATSSPQSAVFSYVLPLTQETLVWRRDFQPEIIPPDEVAPEAISGKHVLCGFDREARPILYLRPGNENTKTGPRQIRYMVWSLERGINLMPPGQETLTIVVDFHGISLSTMPSLSTARHVANILQTHYVERLGRAFVCHMPRYISAFFNGLSPFLDPVTKDKIRFNPPDMSEFIAPGQLDDNFPGGAYPYAFDFDVYWPALIQRCGIQRDGTRIAPAE